MLLGIVLIVLLGTVLIELLVYSSKSIDRSIDWYLNYKSAICRSVKVNTSNDSQIEKFKISSITTFSSVRMYTLETTE